MTDREELARFRELLGAFDTAMLVTRGLDGGPRARPMAIAGQDTEQALLYLASRADDQKLDEIGRCPDVAVTMQGPDKYMSITGRAEIRRDSSLAAELWSPSMKLWFPDGPADEALSLIVVTLLRGEYWDRGGLLKLEFLWEAGKALLRHEKLHEERLSGHAKVKPRGAD